MGKIVIDNDFFKKANYKFSTKHAVFFKKNLELIKLFKRKNLNFQDELIIRNLLLEELSLLNEKEYILPNDILYTKNIDYSNLKGYTMYDQDDYVVIDKIYRKLNYKQKLELCKKICAVFLNLEKHKIAYWDVHLANILVNKLLDIKLCDMDSVTSKRISGEFIYRVDLACSSVNLASSILSILYNIDELKINDLIVLNRHNPIINSNGLFKEIIDSKGNVFYPQKYLELFTEDYIKDSKKILKAH